MLSNILSRKQVTCVSLAIVIFIGLNGWILRNAPIKGGDTHHYLDAVDELYENGSITKRNQNYSGYVIFLTFCKVITPDRYSYISTSIIIQTFVSLVALLSVYYLGISLFSFPTAALSTLFFSLNYYSLFWNQYVLTDSLFISFVIIACATAILASHNKKYLVVSMPAIIFMAMLRPNGLIFFSVFLIYMISTLRVKARALIYTILVICVTIGASFLSTQFQKATNRIQILDNLERGTLIWNQEHIEMPKMEKRSGETVKDTLNYFIDYPKDVIYLAVSRIYINYYFVRDGYSKKHVVFLMIALPLFYLLFIAGVVRGFTVGINRDKLLLLGIIVAQTIIFAGTYADYDPRFLCYIISLTALFAFYGFEWIIKPYLPPFRPEFVS